MLILKKPSINGANLKRLNMKALINKEILHKLNLSIFFILLLLSYTVSAKDRLPIDITHKLLAGEYQQVIQPLQQLAEKNNTQAQYQLGLCYLHGRGVNKSANQAEHWLLLAAKTHAKASYLLGSLYMQGKVLKKDNDKAKNLFSLSIQQGNNKAKKKLNTLNRYMLSSGKLSHSLIKAIKSGNLNTVKYLQKQGEAFNYQTPQGNTPLMLAIEYKQPQVALWLLSNIKEKPLQLAYKNNKKNNALQLSIMKDTSQVSHEILNKLINKEEKKRLSHNKATIKKRQYEDIINNQNAKKETALILSVKNNDAQLAQRLINEGAKLSLKDSNNKTALYYAKTANIALVIKNNNRTKTKKNDKHQNNGLIKLSSQQLSNKIQALTAQAKDKQNPYYQWPLLTIAVAQKQHLLIDALLVNKEKGKHTPWQTNTQKNSAINIAIKQENYDIALKLLNNSMNGHPPSAKQLFPLFYSAIKNLSIEPSLKPNSTQQNNRELKIKVIKKLLSLTTEITFAKAPIEKTPLWLTIQFNQREAFLLIAKKFPPKKSNTNKAKSYLLFATELNLSTISHLLISMNVNVNSINNKKRNALWYAADFANSNLVESLIHAGVTIDLIDVNGYTPLMRAVINNCKECVTHLMNANADAQKQTESANSALMFAAQGKAEILEIILNYYANNKARKDQLNIKQRNRHSLTALMLAVKSQNINCIALLLKAGANPKRKNENGENSFDLAKDNNQILTLLNQ